MIASLLLAMAAAGAGASEPSAPGAKNAVYIGATVYDGVAAEGRSDMAIITHAGRIEAMVPTSAVHVPKDTEVIDVHGKFVVPGFINTHVHLATSADPSAAKAYLKRELYGGVTAVRDMAGDVRLLGELKREAEFDEIPSPDIYYAALMAGPEFFVDPRTHQAARGRVAGEVPWMQAVTSETDIPIAVALARGTGATAIKLYADLSAALVRSITAEAHRQGLRVWAHAAVFPARPSEIVDAGVDVVSHACMLGYEVSDPMPSEVAPPVPVEVSKLEPPNERFQALLSDMRQRGTILDATLYVYFADDSGVRCKYELAAKLAGEAYRAGVSLSAGTDDGPGDDEPGVGGKDDRSAFAQELVLLVEGAGMTPAEAIRAATLVGARTIGRDKDMGSLEPGKLADFVVLGKDPMIDIHNVRSIYMTVKNGLRFERKQYRPAAVRPRTH
jgi:imidazolonepropionase-like amidohydrolase